MSTKTSEQTHETFSLILDRIENRDLAERIIRSVCDALLDQYKQGLKEGLHIRKGV